MRLSLPDPRAALGLVDEMTSVLPRLLALLTIAERTLARVDGLLDRIDATRESADAVIERTDVTVTKANALIVRAAGTLGSLDPTVDRAQGLLDSFAPVIDELQPILERLVRSTSPEEVAAVVRLVDHMPMLVDKLTEDILPIIETMGTVAPDIHDLLDTAHELNEMLVKIPGMGRIRRRVDEHQSAEDSED
ncbi:hypothetical protein [Aeromicrobium sp.]|uniref:hypothetical protein n=1 Tax=Aeromicrobium sp. TaxID=1871063 RepID=UPI003C6512D1